LTQLRSCSSRLPLRPVLQANRSPPLTVTRRGLRQCRLHRKRSGGSFGAIFPHRRRLTTDSRPDSIKEFFMISKKIDIALAGIALAATFS
jgi:hypothetical protein